MKKPRIVLDSSLPYLKGLIEQVAEVTYLESRAFSPETIRGADALLIRSVVHCDETLLSGSSVRMIATATAGYDHIDTSYCAEHAITWRNAPGCNAGGVVQYVLSSLSAWSLDRGIDLMGKTIGIIGVGHVGGGLLKRIGALGLRPLLYDPPRADREGTEGFSSLEEVLRESDILTLHVPLTREGKYPTAGMVDESFLRACQRRPLLINACRGGVAPSAPLLRALDEGWIREVIIDCWEGEPHISSELACRAYIATPHVAGWTADGKWRGSRMALEAICESLGLECPEWLWDDSLLPQPESPRIRLRDYPEEERVRRAQLHTCDPRATTVLLRAHPDEFEQLRRGYVYPREASAFMLLDPEVGDREALRLLGFRDA